MKKLLAIAVSILAAALCLKLEFRLGLRWQDGLVTVLTTGLWLSALLAFIELEATPAFVAFFATLLLYDVFLSVTPPLPRSLITMYTTMTVIGLTVYLSVYEAQVQGIVRGFTGLLDSPSAIWHRRVVLALVPLWFSAVVLARSFPELTPPTQLRIVHPEPPTEISAFGKSFNLVTGTSPFRKYQTENPEKFAGLVAEGKTVYYQNCFYCHGDNLDGKGHFAKGFNPPPANFQDIGTIAMLQEGFVFWRVSKGGPGLPKASHPWASAMPVWEDMLSEDQIWKAILFIYAGTNHEPRRFATTAEEKK